MIFKTLRPNLLLGFLVLLFSSCLLSCGHDNEPDGPVSEENMKRVLLVYAVNHSSLKFDFKSDSIEITKAMQNVDLSKFQVLVYKTVDRENTALYKFAKNDQGKKVFSEIVSYPRSVTSTDPSRMREVISDALALYPHAQYDLIFWGHGTAWVPGAADNNVYGPQRAYGGEYNGNTTSSGSPITSWANLQDLVSVVPDHKFDNIWFDCCYMSSIELIYDFRNKANLIIAYPTEVLSGGMAYDLVLPYLLSETPDIIGGAEAFFNEYNRKFDPVTVAVIDTRKINDVVMAAKDIINVGFSAPDFSEMVNYSRMSSAKLVDFVTYFSWIADNNSRPDLKERLKNVYDNMVIYSAASKIDFRNFQWDIDKVNCVSCYYYTGDSENTTVTDYFKSLDWFKTVF